LAGLLPCLRRLRARHHLPGRGAVALSPGADAPVGEPAPGAGRLPAGGARTLFVAARRRAGHSRRPAPLERAPHRRGAPGLSGTAPGTRPSRTAGLRRPGRAAIVAACRPPEKPAEERLMPIINRIAD